MNAHRLVVQIPPSRHLVVDLPADFPEGDVEIIALARQGEGLPAGAPGRGSVEAVRAATAAVDAMDFPRRTREEIDRELAVEHASWGDDDR